ncbi:galactose-3-O-sulfotransferase 3-like isoform X2 [Dermacentor albipictus]|uniref:galactose-3-O-sulfotransferase 3-like isoform X2 n=1 Tax=Dermacentor albipictus TaxID=60249 RepID=UPI0038FCC0D4
MPEFYRTRCEGSSPGCAAGAWRCCCCCCCWARRRGGPPGGKTSPRECRLLNKARARVAASFRPCAHNLCDTATCLTRILPMSAGATRRGPAAGVLREDAQVRQLVGAERAAALRRRTNYLGHPRPFHRSMAPPFGVLAHHARFREAEVRPRFLTIVREPAALFESLYSYYDLGAKTRLSLEQLASGSRSLSARLARRRTRSKLGFNQMSFDLGLEPAQFANASAVRRFVERLDATFDLVMVAERINESLVLLCADLDDVVVFRHNARQVRVQTRCGLRRPATGVPRAAGWRRELNAADVQLYEHFARRFEQRVRRFGMARELRLLEQRTRHWHRAGHAAGRRRPGLLGQRQGAAVPPKERQLAGVRAHDAAGVGVHGAAQEEAVGKRRH